jgi:polar amino acid transport system substrate-binding protein
MTCSFLPRRRLAARLMPVAVFWLAAGIATPWTWSATSVAATDHPLRVVTTPVAQFVLPKTTPPAGFSIDLWNEVARRMRVEFAWNVVANEAEMLQAVQRGDADVAIAAVAMTPERESAVDFSHPYFNSGL